MERWYEHNKIDCFEFINLNIEQYVVGAWSYKFFVLKMLFF